MRKEGPVRRTRVPRFGNFSAVTYTGAFLQSAVSLGTRYSLILTVTCIHIVIYFSVRDNGKWRGLQRLADRPLILSGQDELQWGRTDTRAKLLHSVVSHMCYNEL